MWHLLKKVWPLTAHTGSVMSTGQIGHVHFAVSKDVWRQASYLPQFKSWQGPGTERDNKNTIYELPFPKRLTTIEQSCMDNLLYEYENKYHKNTFCDCIDDFPDINIWIIIRIDFRFIWFDFHCHNVIVCIRLPWIGRNWINDEIDIFLVITSVRTISWGLWW